MKAKIKTYILKIGVTNCGCIRAEKFKNLQIFLSKLSSLPEVEILKITQKNVMYKSYEDLVKIVFKMPIGYVDIISMASQYPDLVIKSYN